MRTTLNLDDKLLEEALHASGLKGKTAVIHEGLRALVSRARARRLAALGGTMPKLKAGRRRRGEPG